MSAGMSGMGGVGGMGGEAGMSGAGGMAGMAGMSGMGGAGMSGIAEVLANQGFNGRDLVLSRRERRGVAFGRARPLFDEDHEEGGVESAALHLSQVDPQFGFLASVETRLAHVAARNVDVGI